MLKVIQITILVQVVPSLLLLLPFLPLVVWDTTASPKRMKEVMTINLKEDAMNLFSIEANKISVKWKEIKKILMFHST